MRICVYNVLVYIAMLGLMWHDEWPQIQLIHGRVYMCLFEFCLYKTQCAHVWIEHTLSQ